MYKLFWTKTDKYYFGHTNIWINRTRTLSGIDIETLHRANYLSESMTDLTGVEHSVETYLTNQI